MDKLRKLLLEKEKSVVSEEEKNKVNLLKKLFLDDNIFFKLDISTAYGILRFLGISDEEIDAIYYNLISYENYEKIMPKYRVEFLDDTLH